MRPAPWAGWAMRGTSPTHRCFSHQMKPSTSPASVCPSTAASLAGAARAGVHMPEIDTQFVFKTEAARGGLALKPITLHEPRGREVLIAIHSASICGTDLHLYRWNEWAS